MYDLGQKLPLQPSPDPQVPPVGQYESTARNRATARIPRTGGAPVVALTRSGARKVFSQGRNQAIVDELRASLDRGLEHGVYRRKRQGLGNIEAAVLRTKDAVQRLRLSTAPQLGGSRPVSTGAVAATEADDGDAEAAVAMAEPAAEYPGQVESEDHLVLGSPAESTPLPLPYAQMPLADRIFVRGTVSRAERPFRFRCVHDTHAPT